MTCDQAREALFPDPEASDAGLARAHFRDCVACQRFFTWQRQLGDRLAALPQAAASPLLRARLRLLPGARRRRRGFWTVAAAAAAIVIAAVLMRPNDPTAPFAPAAQYLTTLPMESGSADLFGASNRLSAQLAMPLALPDIEGAEFLGAGLVDVSGTMWAGARYRFKGMTVAYFALPMDHVEPDSSMASGTSGKWEVAVWTEEGGMRALAGERPLTRDEVLALAAECRAMAAMPVP